MNKRILIVVLTVGLVLIAGLAGYGLGRFQISPLVKSGVSQFLDSRLVKDFNITLSGKIVSIVGENLTIGKDGQSLSLIMPKDITVMRQKEFSGTGLVPPPETIKPEDLKTGDFVSVFLLLNSNGTSTALNIMVLPEPTPSPLPEK